MAGRIDKGKFTAPFAVLILFLLGVDSVPLTGDCLCATTGVNGRQSGSLSASIVTVLSQGSCGVFHGGHVYNNGYNWYQLDYEGKIVWVASNYLSDSNCPASGPGSNQNGACPTIVTRSEWGARSPASVSLITASNVEYAFIHHSDTASCNDFATCSAKVRSFQNYHMDSKHWSDIGYSFLIGGDGSVYEGRGWDRVGAHTYGYNSVGLGFCFIGTFTSQSPSQVQLDAAQNLISCGVAAGKIRSDYVLRGHRDMVSTTCPGDRLYGIIQNWPHY